MLLGAFFQNSNGILIVKRQIIRRHALQGSLQSQTDFSVIEPNSIRKTSSVEPVPPELGITPISSCMTDEKARHSRTESGSLSPVALQRWQPQEVRHRQVIFTAFQHQSIHCCLSLITTLPDFGKKSSICAPGFCLSDLLFLI